MLKLYSLIKLFTLVTSSIVIIIFNYIIMKKKVLAVILISFRCKPLKINPFLRHLYLCRFTENGFCQMHTLTNFFMPAAAQVVNL